jgi:flagellar protein FlaI
VQPSHFLYPLELDGAKVEIELVDNNGNLFYYMNVPEVSPATKTLLDDIRNDLVALTTISVKEIADPEAFSRIKESFRNDAKRLLREKLQNFSPELAKFLIGKLMQDMLGLGEIEFLVADPNLEEIVIPSAKEPIRVYFKKHGWVNTNVNLDNEEKILNYADIVARRVGRQINVLNPLLDAHLVTGDRVNAVLYPINSKGNTLTIRKFARNPYTIVDLISSKTCSLDVAALLWLALEFEMNVIISGGTASGKTVFLNACMPFIPPNHRILSIEDTRELMLPDFLYWTPLVTRTPNPEGKGGISMLDLLINSLRMRPDRIILGEMRKEEEARVLFEAMHTGHSVYATLHADSAKETVSRLVNPPLNVPPNLLKAVNLNVVMHRDRRRGLRRVIQIAEFEAGADTADANILFRWVPENDEIVKHSESLRFYEDLSRHTGMSENKIAEDLEKRKRILNWLVKKNVNNLNDLGKVMHLYYVNEDELIELIQNDNLKGILKKQNEI